METTSRDTRGRGGRPGVGVMLGLRVVISLLVGTLGVVLLAVGSVLVGGLLLALAVVRLVMTALMWNRRRHPQAQIATWRNRRGWPGTAA
jgi:hypothetical protein